MSRLMPAVVFCGLEAAGVAARSPGPILERFDAEAITLVFCSDRTRAEVESIRQDLGVFHPFICEGGAAAFVPGGYFGRRLDGTRDVAGYDAIEFGKPYDHVAPALQRVAARLGIEIRTLSAMSVEQVSQECGLTLLQARLAHLREYVEPFRIADGAVTVPPRLMRALSAAGLHCVTRGSYHLVGTVEDSGPAVSVLTALFRIALGRMLTLGVGREAEDAAWLRRVDVRVIREPGCTGGFAGCAGDILDAVRAARLRCLSSPNTVETR